MKFKFFGMVLEPNIRDYPTKIVISLLFTFVVVFMSWQSKFPIPITILDYIRYVLMTLIMLFLMSFIYVMIWNKFSKSELIHQCFGDEFQLHPVYFTYEDPNFEDFNGIYNKWYKFQNYMKIPIQKREFGALICEGYYHKHYEIGNETQVCYMMYTMQIVIRNEILNGSAC